MTSRNYCFTAFKEPNVEEDHIKYCIFGHEICPETKKEHWQGYVEFEKPIRIAQAQSIIGVDNAHMEVRRGTRIQAIDYCKKDNEYIELGDMNWQKQGKRTDLDNVHEDIKNGLSLTSVATRNFKPFIRYHNGITKLFNMMQSNALEEKDVTVLIGDPGTGKTRFVYDNHNIEDIYNKPNGNWWDGYYGQPVVIIDDIDTNDYKISDMLKWLDRYPIQVPTKGGFVWLKAKKIYLTSNKNIIEWFMPINPLHIEAIGRRIKEFKFLSKNPNA